MLMDTGVVEGGQITFPDEPEVDRDYRMEGHLKAIARWYLWGGVLLVIPALLAGMSLVFGRASREPGGTFYTLVGTAALAAISVLFLAGSHSLSRFSDRARFSLLIFNALAGAFNLLQIAVLLWGPEADGMDPKKSHSALMVAAFSLLWYGHVCWALGSKRSAEVCAPEYRAVALQDPGPSGWTSPFFWMPIVLGCFVISASAALFH